MDDLLKLVQRLDKKVDHMYEALNIIKDRLVVESNPEYKHCQHEYLKTVNAVDRGCMVQCKHPAHHGLPYCGHHYWRYLNNPIVCSGIKKLASCNSYYTRISSKYESILRKQTRSARDHAIVQIYNILNKSREDIPVTHVLPTSPPLQVSPVSPMLNHIRVYGYTGPPSEILELYNRSHDRYADQLKYITNIPTKDLMRSVYTFDFLSYLDASPLLYSNVELLDKPIARFNDSSYTIDTDDSLLLYEMECISKVETSVIQAPLSNDVISMVYEQTITHKTPNIGLILSVDTDRYCKYASSGTINNPLGMYNRNHLDVFRNEALVSTSLKKFTDMLSNVAEQVVNFDKLHTLQYNKYGFLFDPYTSYIYYPTIFGTVCIGVAYIENVKSDTGCDYSSCLTVHIGMLNRFEIMQCIADNRNFLDPYTGEVYYYNKILNNRIVYNSNYYVGGDFLAQDTPPSPINVYLSIPMDLYTTIDACSVCSDGDRTPLNLNPSLILRKSTGTGVSKIDQSMDNYDKYVNALQYLMIPNIFYSVGKLRKSDNWNQCRSHDVLRLSDTDFRFNEALISKQRNQIDNYTARNCMVSVSGRAGISIPEEILDKIIPNMNHVLAVDQRDLGIIIDPLTKYVLTIKGCTNIYIGVVCHSNKIQDVDNLGIISVKRHWRLYHFNAGEIDVCRHRRVNYLDPATGRIVYYSYCDHTINRIVYNLNYFNNPTGPILPCYQPPCYY